LPSLRLLRISNNPAPWRDRTAFQSANRTRPWRYPCPW
jgi:hypothetical protein